MQLISKCCLSRPRACRHLPMRGGAGACDNPKQVAGCVSHLPKMPPTELAVELAGATGACVGSERVRLDCCGVCGAVAA